MAMATVDALMTEAMLSTISDSILYLAIMRATSARPTKVQTKPLFVCFCFWCVFL